MFEWLIETRYNNEARTRMHGKSCRGSCEDRQCAGQKIPAGTFTRCLQIEEMNPLEPAERELKVHAPGVGIVRDGALWLLRYGAPGKNS